MDNVAAYHAPGWPNPLIPANSWTRTPDWDDKEFAIVKHIRLSSFAMNGHPRPPLHPLPIAPKVWLNAQNRTITWQGAAWALSYEIWLAPHTASAPPRVRRPQWQRIAKDVLDALPAGELAFPLPANARGQLRIRGMSVEGKEGAWSNIINV